MLFRGRDSPEKVVVKKNATAVGWASVRRSWRDDHQCFLKAEL